MSAELVKRSNKQNYNFMSCHKRYYDRDVCYLIENGKPVDNCIYLDKHIASEIYSVSFSFMVFSIILASSSSSSSSSHEYY